MQAGFSRRIKRGVDIVVSAFALAGFSPILLVSAAAVRLTMGKPVFFRQERPGLKAQPFRIVKFRTMADERDVDGKLLPDGERLTNLGRVLRRLSIDELPQLLNVLAGEMSLVGPRPLLMEYLPLYTAKQARRHEVLPGITGWAQVNGRNALTHEERFELDVWYVDHWSLLLDIKILLLSVARVVSRSGISADGHVSMPIFRGAQQGDLEARGGA